MTDSVRQLLIKELGRLIDRVRPADRPFVVGITGIDGSGKTELTAELECMLRRQSLQVQTIHVDDFHNPRAVRYAPDLPESVQYYHRSINFHQLAESLLIPIKRFGRIETTLNHLDLLSDTWSRQRHYMVTPDTVVLLEGVFLFRSEIRWLVDFFMYLHVTEDVVLQRARVRDVPVQGEEVMRKYRTKYLPAQREYLRCCNPDQFAHVVIDNSDWARPSIRTWPDAAPLGVPDAH